MADAYLLQCSTCGTEHRVAHGQTGAVSRCKRCGAPAIPAQCLPIPVNDVIWESEMALAVAPAVVVVWSSTCGTCADYEPSVRLMASRLYGRARVLLLDIDQSPVVSARYGVTGVPTVLLFREGNLLASLPGPRGEQGLLERLGID